MRLGNQSVTSSRAYRRVGVTADYAEFTFDGVGLLPQTSIRQYPGVNYHVVWVVLNHVVQNTDLGLEPKCVAHIDGRVSESFENPNPVAKVTNDSLKRCQKLRHVEKPIRAPQRRRPKSR